MYDMRLICLLHVTGDPSTEYVSDETPMRTYANLHVALEQMRVSALSHIRGISVPPREKSNWDPPRVLVVGPEHSGKTTVCKILTNYAVRAGQNWSPFFVNIDPSEVRCLYLSKLVFLMNYIGREVGPPPEPFLCRQFMDPLLLVHLRTL